MDGTGLQEWLEKSDVDRAVRIASGIDTAAEAQFDGVRTGRWVYAEFPVTGERELYDLAEDPNELTNLAGSSTHTQVEARLRSLFLSLRDCVGTACAVPVPKSLA